MNSLFQAVDKVLESNQVIVRDQKQKEDRVKALKEAVERRRLMKLTEAQKAETANLGKLEKGE